MKQLKCFVRSSFGTSSARKLRREGMVPGIIYTSDTKNLPVYFSAHDLFLLKNEKLFGSSPLHLVIEDKLMLVLPKHCDLDPIKDNIRHIEFLADDGNSKLLSIPLFYSNLEKSPGHKNNAFFNITKRNLSVRGLIHGAPKVLIKDIVEIKAGDVVRAGDIELPEGYTLAEKDSKRVIAVMMGKGGGESKKQ